MTGAGLFFSIVLTLILIAGAMAYGIVPGPDNPLVLYGGPAAAGVMLVIWYSFFYKLLFKRFVKKRLDAIDDLIPLGTQTRRDTWNYVRHTAYRYIEKHRGRYPLGPVIDDYQQVHWVATEGAKEVRKALNELSAMMRDPSVVEASAKPIKGHTFDEETFMEPDPPDL